MDEKPGEQAAGDQWRSRYPDRRGRLGQHPGLSLSAIACTPTGPEYPAPFCFWAVFALGHGRRSMRHGRGSATAAGNRFRQQARAIGPLSRLVAMRCRTATRADTMGVFLAPEHPDGPASLRSVRRPLPAQRRRARRPGHRCALHQRARAADHRRSLRRSPFPARTDPGNRRTRPAGLLAAGKVRLRRPQRRQLRPDLPGARTRRQRHPQLRQRAVLAVHVPDLRLRQRRTARALAAVDGARRNHRLLRPDRTARRLRSGQHEDQRPQGRRRLDPQRFQDVDHQRQRRRHRHRLGADRRRHPGLRGREGHGRLRRPGNQAQDEPARLGHQRAVSSTTCACRKPTACRT